MSLSARWEAFPTRSCFYRRERFTYEPVKHDCESALLESIEQGRTNVKEEIMQELNILGEVG